MVRTYFHLFEPSDQALKDVFVLKYGEPESTGWAPSRRFRFGYFHPAEHYEALVEKLVGEGARWLDVGGGASPFPQNARLAGVLAARVSAFVGVDPSPNLEENPFVTERANCLIENYRGDRAFDVVTLRMVAEHVENPESVVVALGKLTDIGGRVVVLTPNLWTPITIFSRLTPFVFHYAVKRLFWGGRRADTFPAVYRMNTRRQLRRLFERAGFEERYFRYIDDCSAFARFFTLNYVELVVWRLFKLIGIRYPENCLLAVYEKRGRQSGKPAGNGLP